MGKPNYALKAEVLNNHADMLAHQKRARAVYRKSELWYIHHGNTPNAELDEELRAVHDENAFFYSNGQNYDLMKECERIDNADGCRKRRLNRYIASMLDDGPCLFITCTFTDDTLERCNPLTLRRAFTAFLKQHSDWFVGNVDYGAQNGRMHFHAVIRCDKVNHLLWKYGTVNFKRVHKSSDARKLASYINKLTNHAVKATAGRNALIYSRPKKKLDELPF